MAIRSTASEAEKSQFVKESRSQLPLVKRNFIWMGIAGLLIVTGFLLMLGGSSTVEEFNPDIFSTRRIVVGPTLAFAGYVLMAVAILLKPSIKDNDKQGEEVSDELA